MPEKILAEGIWCNECGTFEYDLILLDENCPSCGCPKKEHVKAKVIKDSELWSNVAPELTPEDLNES